MSVEEAVFRALAAVRVATQRIHRSIIGSAHNCRGRMTEVVYAIEIDTLNTTGLTMVRVKIGKTTDLESRLASYQTGILGEPEVLNI